MIFTSDALHDQKVYSQRKHVGWQSFLAHHSHMPKICSWKWKARGKSCWVGLVEYLLSLVKCSDRNLVGFFEMEIIKKNYVTIRLVMSFGIEVKHVKYQDDLQMIYPMAVLL